jgi:nucleotide-binding universal stress UspA family protein
MFKSILVPLDGSIRAEQAISLAARIARVSGGSVILLRVVTIPIEFGPYLRQSVLLREVVNADLAHAAGYLANIAQSDDLRGIETKVAVFSGPEALTILDTAKDQGVDLIIMASHGDTGLKRWMLGSVAQKVARYCPVPVLVLREGGTVPSSPYPDQTRPLHAIAAVVALDGSALSEAALFPAAHLVAALTAPAQGSLHLTRVVQRPGVDAVLNGRERMDPLQRDQALDEAMNYLSKLADDLRNRLEAELNLAITWSVAVDADVAETLIRVAEQGRVDAGTCMSGGCDILAIATHGRSGLQRWVIGSVTERVLGATKLPLLIVRPLQEQYIEASETTSPERRVGRDGRMSTCSRGVNKCGPVFAWHAPHIGVNASIYKKRDMQKEGVGNV